MAELKMPHPEHENHLCLLHNVGYLKTNLNDFKNLVKDGKFICRNWPVAASEKPHNSML
jgi:hypothetical protein